MSLTEEIGPKETVYAYLYHYIHLLNDIESDHELAESIAKQDLEYLD